MSNENVGYLLTRSARRFPKKNAIIFNDHAISYEQLNQRVNRLAHGLMSIGINKGDRIGYIFPNGIEIVELFFAIQKIGAVAVPLNHRLVSREIKFLLDAAECKVFVYSDLYSLKVNEIKDDLNVEIIIRSGEEVAGEISFEKLFDNGNVDEPDVIVDGQCWSRIQFTGGTTGRSKGVIRTHDNDIFMSLAIMAQNKMGVSPDEVILTQCPLHHQGGISWLLPTIANSGEIVICDTFDPVAILEQIQKWRVTYLLLLPPSSYLRLLDIPNLNTFDLSSVKVVQASAGGTSTEIINTIYDAFPNCEVLYAWGQTEVGTGTMNFITREMALNNPEKANSVGREFPFTEIRLVDDLGQDVAVGETGECIVKGPSVTSGYYNQPELTAEAVKDGWIYTGDMMKKDEAGFYYFMDRKKDMIKTGGENVFAQEVEGVIRSHPAIEDCAVIGVPDRKFGEAVMAVIKLRPDRNVSGQEIIKLCQESLSSYKKPRYIEFVNSFPVDQAGKIQKFRLREIYSKQKLQTV